MSIATTPMAYTPEDLLKMPDSNHYELVDGQLVQRKMSTLASFVAGGVFKMLSTHCDQQEPAWVFPEGTSYQCFPNAPTRVRRADVSVFRWERRTLEDFQHEGHCPLAPDLAVEVVSPNDEFYEVEEKVQEWLNAGVALVWVVNPQLRRVYVHRAAGTVSMLREHDELTGEDVLPSFRCRVGDFFKVPLAKSPA